MSILKEIKRLFGVKGASIEEALKNVDSIGGGGSGSGGVEIIEATYDEEQNATVLNKTYAEIEQMASEKKAIYVYFTHNGLFSQNYTYEPVTGVYASSENAFLVETIHSAIGSYDIKTYTASGSDGYPSFKANNDDAPLS